MKSVFILENCNFIRMASIFDDSTFLWNVRIFLYFKEGGFHHGFEHILFFLSTLRMSSSVCWISVFKPSYLSSSLFAFIYLSFLCICASACKTVFHHLNSCFWFQDFASYYFNVFVGSAVILFLLSVFFNCQLLLSHSDVLSP